MGTSVLLTKYETSDLAAMVVAFVEKNGDLVLVGCDSDNESQREWEARIANEQKEAFLLSLVQRCFGSDVTFRSLCSWLEESQIPYKLSEATDVDPSGP